MPDYLCAVQRVLTNVPKCLTDALALWCGEQGQPYQVAHGHPVAYPVTADTPADAMNLAADRYEAEHPPLTLDGGAVENYLVNVQLAEAPVLLATTPAVPQTVGAAGTVDLGAYGRRTPSPGPNGTGGRWYRDPGPRPGQAHDPNALPAPDVLPAEVFDRLTQGDLFRKVNGLWVRHYPTAQDAYDDALLAARGAAAALAHTKSPLRGGEKDGDQKEAGPAGLLRGVHPVL